MLFTTLPYAAFFGVTWAVHWVAPRPLRRPWLLIASYFFYAQTFPQYLCLILALTAVNYGFGLALGWMVAVGAWPATPLSPATNLPPRDHLPPSQSAQADFVARRPLGAVLTARVPRRPLGANSFARVPHTTARVSLLILAISANLGTLAYFKYAGFLAQTAWQVARILPSTPANAPVLNIILPLGISFFTFEFIHYAVEVARGQPPVRNPIDFALFAAFFPTQIAGPIKRIPDWVKQLRQPLRLRDIQADEAIKLILRGLVKKIIVADTLAPLVANGFDHASQLGFFTAWVAIFAFAAQIYADFSGYTDIGRGCALLLGYSVPENFRSPYQARDPGEFWERWHITLSRWLRDYLYIPLGGSRVALPRVYLNLLITMALGGLWHGASWHFVLWGVAQGGLLIAQRLWDRATAFVPPLKSFLAGRHGILLGRFTTFLLVCLGWTFFRADTSTALGAMLRAALIPASAALTAGWPVFVPPASALALVVLATCGLTVITGWLWSWAEVSLPGWHWLLASVAILRARWLPALRPIVYLALLMLICIWPSPGTQRFIYFQF